MLLLYVSHLAHSGAVLPLSLTSELPEGKRVAKRYSEASIQMILEMLTCDFKVL